MRQIKFRAWDVLNNCFLSDDWLERNLFLATKTHSVEVMQYTGLKDKNGVEIYEGDIVLSRHKDRHQEIIWDDDINGFSCIYNYKEGGTSLTALQHPNNIPLEVIGNIYEDTHLLEKKHD